MKNIKQKLIIVGVLVAVVSLIGAILIYFSQKKGVAPIPLTITSSTPSNGASEVSVFDPITITFNHAVDPSTIRVISDPSEVWTISQTAQSTLTVDHELYLKVATTYKINVLQHGNVLGTITFETAREQNDPRQLQALQSEVDKNYPLASLTPYETSNYRVVYSAPLTLEIDLKRSMSTEGAISQVQMWVKSNGIDPATHKYIVIAASPTP